MAKEYGMEGGIERLLDILGEPRVLLIRDKLERIYVCEDVHAVFVHGSFSRGVADTKSDLDLLVVVADHAVDSQIAELRREFAADRRVVAHAGSDRFPWFGHLEAAVYGSPVWFAFEVGIVSEREFERFYVEPDAWILKDRDGCVEGRRKACLVRRREEIRQYRNNLGYELLNLTMKFAKAMERGHLWNAYNYCSVARRMFFDLERSHAYGSDAVFVGLVERRIESELSTEIVRQYTDTAPRYDVVDLARVFVELLDVLLTRTEVQRHKGALEAVKRWRDSLHAAYGNHDKPAMDSAVP